MVLRHLIYQPANDASQEDASSSRSEPLSPRPWFPIQSNDQGDGCELRHGWPWFCYLGAANPAYSRVPATAGGGLIMMDYLVGLAITTGVGFGLIALGLYVEVRWIGLPRRR